MTKNTGAGAFAVNSVNRCIWNILFPIKAPFAKQMLLFWSLHFCLLSSTKSVPVYLLTCWKYKQSHIFISSCPNDPSQLQNCGTKRFLTVFGTLLVTWRQRKEILSSTHPHTPKQKMSCVFFRTFHSVWCVRHCTASTIAPNYGPHLVYYHRTHFILYN